MRIFTAKVIALAIFYLTSCGGGTQQNQTEEKIEFEIEEPTQEEVPVVFTVIAINHEVQDWSTWKQSYDDRKQTREDAGLKELDLLRDLDNRNEVMILLRSKDHASAQDFSSSDDLKASMETAGLDVEPQIWYWDIVQSNDAEEANWKYRLLISHEVRDFSTWKPAFDDHETVRQEAGINILGVARDRDKPNLVSIMFAFDDLEKAQKYATSEELRIKMDEAGVIGKPGMKWMVVPDQDTII